MKQIVGLIFILSLTISFGQEAKIKKSYTSTDLGTYIAGELKIEETHAAPIVDPWDKEGNFLSSETLDSAGGTIQRAFVYTYNSDGTVDSDTHYNDSQDEIWDHVMYTR
ncbi:MAG: hypothetical protein ACI837_002691 [Crocinitomicaceae bacterium]|jgi:hypothetical protein